MLRRVLAGSGFLLTGVLLGFVPAMAMTDIVAPVVGSVSPTATQVSAVQLYSAPFTDNVGVTGCDLYADGTYRGAMTLTGSSATSGEATVNLGFLTARSYSVQVRCSDAAGNVGMGTVTAVTVSAATPATSTVSTVTPPPAAPAPSAPACELTDGQANVLVLATFGSLSPQVNAAVSNFVACGTPTTRTLGSGERLGVVNSFYAAFDRVPSTDADWNDLNLIANGQKPVQASATAEANARVRFRTIYRRAPSTNIAADNRAVATMAYGLRTQPRNLSWEVTAGAKFYAIFKTVPRTAVQWDAVRAIAYSGATR